MLKKNRETQIYNNLIRLIKSPWVLSICSGILFILAGPKWNFYVFGWVFIVPLIFAVENQSYQKTFSLAYLMLFIVGLGYGSWIEHMLENYAGVAFPVNYLGMLLYMLLLAPAMGLVFVSDKFIRTHIKVPQFITIPIIYTVIWQFYPTIFNFNIGMGQISIKPILQPMEFFGVEGLDFIMIMFGSLIAHWLTGKRKTYRVYSVITSAIIISWVVTGIVLFDEWDNRINSWDQRKIAIVQPNRLFSSNLQISKYPKEMKWTEEAAQKGAEVAIWPEGIRTGFEQVPAVKKAFLGHASRIGIPILINDSVFKQEKPTNSTNAYVSAINIWPNGEVGYYHKMKLVPFGEYIPLKSVLEPFLDLMSITLQGYTPGTDTPHFNNNGMFFVPKICYEVIFSSSVAESVGKDGNGRIFVFQSQDIWYGSSQQVWQHLIHSIFRGIENRLPMIHVINNGVSIAATPHGEILLQTPYFQEGYWIADIPFNSKSGGSFFSRNPHLFINVAGFLFILLISASIYFKKINHSKACFEIL